MLTRVALYLSSLIITVNLIGCSDSASETDPINNPNKPPITKITPDQEYIGNQKDIVFTCFDPNVNDSCTNTYVDWSDNPDEIFEPTLESRYLFKNKLNVAGTHNATISVKYFSVDKSGTKEPIQTKTYILDTEPPSVSSNIEAGIFSETQWVSFNCSDSGSQQCKFIHYYTSNVNDTTPSNYIIEPIDQVSIQVSEDQDLHFRAEDAAGNLTDEAINTYTFATEIANVSNLRAEPDDGKVLLSWKNPEDPNLEGVLIVRKAGSRPVDENDGDEIFNGVGETHLDASLTNGAEYYYRVWAYNNATPNKLSSSLAVTAVPTTDPAPGAVGNFEAQPGNGKVELSWVNPSDDYAYTIIKRDILGPPQSQNDGDEIYQGVAQSYTDTPLTNHIKYYYTVFAFDSNNQASEGVSSNATPQDLLPGIVTSMTLFPGEGFVDLAWVKPNDQDLSSIQIIRNIDSPPLMVGGIITRGTLVSSCSSDINNTTCKDSDVINGTNYYYGAFATDNGGNVSGLFVKGPVTPKDVTRPNPVANLEANSGDGIILLKWQKPFDADYAGVKILRSNIDKFADITNSSPSDYSVIEVNNTAIFYSDKQLDNNKTYYYSFYAQDSAGNLSTVVLVKALTNPEAVSTPPQVSSTTPTDGETGVKPTLPIVVTVDEDVLPDSVDNSVITLKGTQYETTISGSVSQILANTVSFAPGELRLPLATQVTASVGGITDLSNNALVSVQTPDSQFSWSFTTADGKWDASAISLSNTNDANHEFEPAVAVDGLGNAVAIWPQIDPISLQHTIMARHYNLTAGWDNEDRITPISSTIVDARNPIIKSDGKGNYLAVWYRGDFVYANRYLKNTGWESKEILIQNDKTRASSNNQKLSAIIDSNGVATILWAQTNGAQSGEVSDMWARRFDLLAPSSDWDALPTKLPPAELIEWSDDRDADFPNLAADGLGNVIAVWYQPVIDGTNLIRSVMYNRFDSTLGTWGQPLDLANPVHPYPPLSNLATNVEFATPGIGMDAKGNAIVTWAQREIVPRDPTGTFTYSVVFASEYTINPIDPNVPWSTPVIISDNTIDANTAISVRDNTYLAMHSSGTAVVVWSQSGLSGTIANKYDPNAVTVSKWLGEILFTEKRDTASEYASDLIMDSNANVTLLMDNGGHAVTHRYLNTTSWNSAQVSDISNTFVIETIGINQNINDIDLAVGPHGNAIAVWAYRVGVDSISAIRSNTFNFK